MDTFPGSLQALRVDQSYNTSGPQGPTSGLPERLLGVQASLDVTDLITQDSKQYGYNVVVFQLLTDGA